MHRQRLEGKWAHTWATSRHALSIERVSAQFRNTKYITCVTKHKLKLFEKIHFENRSLYLKIGFLEIKYNNENFRNQI